MGEGLRMEASAPRIEERIVTLRSGAAALDGLPEVLWQAGGRDLDTVVQVASQVAGLAVAAVYAATREAVARGEVADSQAGSLHDWLTARAPSLSPSARGAIAKAVPELARRGSEDFDAAVASGRLSPDLGVACAKEWTRLAERITPEAAATVREGLVTIAAADGVREMRKLRPALLARYGVDGEFQEEQDRLRDQVALSAGRPDELGMVTYQFVADPEGYAVLEAAIGPLARPFPDPETGAPDPRTPEQRRGQALVEALRRSSHVANSGGTLAGAKATVFVTISAEDLADGTGSGQVGGTVAAGTLLGAETVQRLSCDGIVAPVVLGAGGELLALGRAARFFSAAQVKALWVRDGGCTFPGCSAPATWCDAHHIQHWSQGGPTDVHNGALLCGRHHSIVHRDHLIAQVTASGVVWDTTRRDRDGQPTTWRGNPAHVPRARHR